MTWSNVPSILAISLPLSGVVLTVALKVIYNKKRKVLPCCDEKFKSITKEMEIMKKGSTDRQSMVDSVKAAIQLLTKSNDENRENYKELSKAINETAKEVAVISANLIFLTKTIEGKIKTVKRNE